MKKYQRDVNYVQRWCQSTWQFTKAGQLGSSLGGVVVKRRTQALRPTSVHDTRHSTSVSQSESNTSSAIASTTCKLASVIGWADVTAASTIHTDNHTAATRHTDSHITRTYIDRPHVDSRTNTCRKCVVLTQQTRELVNARACASQDTQHICQKSLDGSQCPENDAHVSPDFGDNCVKVNSQCLDRRLFLPAYRTRTASVDNVGNNYVCEDGIDEFTMRYAMEEVPKCRKCENGLLNHPSTSARNSLDSAASDNVFAAEAVGPGAGDCLQSCSSLSDVTSVSSLSSCISSSKDTTTSRMRFELRHGKHQSEPEEPVEYLTPLQRSERELRLLRKERIQLVKELSTKDGEITSLRESLRFQKEEMERQQQTSLAELRERLRVVEKEKFEEEEELCRVQEELSNMDTKYTELKKEMSQKEEKFEEYLLDMYKKGQEAATFEREQELEMLATSHPRPRVSVRELTRKLSRTELELARWQGLRLEESYHQPPPLDTQADVTLGFLKDAFFHFLTDRSDAEVHLRAIVRIFKYSKDELSKMRKGLEDIKFLDKKRMLLK